MALVIIFAFSSMPKMTMTTQAAETNEFAGGSGTEADPYLISTATHLNIVRNYPDKYFEMTNDIVLKTSDYSSTSTYWEPISNFSGGFDGNGFAIENLRMSRLFSGEAMSTGGYRTYGYFGLFGNVSGAVSNLHLKNVNLLVNVKKLTTSSGGNSTNIYLGAVAGYVTGTVKNCSVSGTIKSNSNTEITSAYVGGIVGNVYGEAGSIENCYNASTITGSFTYDNCSVTVGGISGMLNGSEIKNCGNTGTISATAYDSPEAAGIVGRVASMTFDDAAYGTVSGCFNYGKINSECTMTTSSSYSDDSARAGGITTWLSYDNNLVTGCGNFGEVYAYGLDSYAGGIVTIVSSQGGQIESCFNTGSVTASDKNSTKYGSHNAAGISESGGTISKCFNSGSINAYGNDYLKAGGITTCSFTAISNCYNTGEVGTEEGASSSRAAGIITDCPTVVEHCYNVGTISGSNIGAIASMVYAGGDSLEPEISDCYYLDTMSAAVNSNTNGYEVDATKCTSDKMKVQSTFSGFDFSDIWMMGTGGYKYPQFKNNRHAGAELDDTCSRIGHMLVTYPAKEATCTEGGCKEYQVCFICDYTTYEEVEATGHNFGDWECIETPTCTEGGYEARVCKACGAMGYGEVLCDTDTYPESAHPYANNQVLEDSVQTFTYPDAKKLRIKFTSTTFTENNFDYVYIYLADAEELGDCTLVGKYMGSSLASKELEIDGNSFKIGLTSDGSVNKYGFEFESIYALVVDGVNSREVEPLGHDEIHHEAKSACTETGWKEYVTCSRCDYTTYEEIEPQGHKLEKVEANNATCEKDGNIAYYFCTECKKLYSDEDGTKEITLADTIVKAKDHAYAESWTTDEKNHWHVCENNCSVKGNEAAHSFEWVVDKEATEDETGLKHEECTVCGYKQNENTAIDKLAHTHNMKKTEKVDATCEKDGNIEYYTCTKCGKLYTDEAGTKEITLADTIVKAKDHAYAESWTADGKSHWHVCENNCSVKGSEEAHSFEWVIDKEATEDETGLKHEECTVCGYKQNENTVIDKLPHTHAMTKTEGKDATCTTAGIKTYYTCSKCNKMYSDENGNLETTKEDLEIKALGHDYVAEVTEPTVTSQGYTTYTCSRCNDSYKDNYTDPLKDTSGFGEENVYRVFGNDRYGTSFKTADAYKAQLGVDKFENVIVACGKDFADALAGSYLAGVKQAPILMASDSQLNNLKDYISKNLEKDGTIYILGGKSAVSEKIENGLKAYGMIKRLGGYDRYETNILILKEAGVADKDILVCTGKNFADSLSASALGRPILLVKDKLTVQQKEYLKGLSGNKYYLIGGEKAVTPAMAKEIKAYGTTTRIGGETRYETSVMVAEAFFKDPQAAVLAYAMNFPDGLCGGPLAMSKNAPLILTATKSATAAIKYVQKE